MKAEIKYEAIEVNKAKYSVALMCRFFEVSRSGYYASRKRKDRPERDVSIRMLIAQCQHEVKETYGNRRVRLWLLQKHGLVVNYKAVIRLMRK